MANTCFTNVTVTGPMSSLRALSDRFRALRPDFADGQEIKEPVSADELFDAAGIPASGGRAMEVDVFHLSDGEADIYATSKWRPQLSAIKAFLSKFAPDCGMHFFAAEPMTDLYLADQDGYVFMDIQCGDGDPAKAELDKWDTILSEADALDKMAKLLGEDPSIGLDAMAAKMTEQHDVIVIRFQTTTWEEACK